MQENENRRDKEEGLHKEDLHERDLHKRDLHERTLRAFGEFKETVARLRAPDGCPWDRAQTHESLKPECVEEAAEVVSGINILTRTGKPDSLIEELGDLLMQVVLHAQIAEEEGLFTMEDVLLCVNEKMIRRHPHVFGDKSLEYLRKLDGGRTDREKTSVPADWKKLKALEKKGREWEEKYLFEAFDESRALIEQARNRKLRDRQDRETK